MKLLKFQLLFNSSCGHAQYENEIGSSGEIESHLNILDHRLIVIPRLA